MPKYLIVGLGNPGRDYTYNRHNVGFMAVSRLAAKHNTAFTRKQGKALVTTFKFDDKQIILAKPQTYMNLSGEAVQALVKFYAIELAQLLICYDDLDLPVGSLRIRPDGGPGGQNGVKSIIKQLGTQNFPRLRLGIGRPPGRMDPAAYVLQDFKGPDAEIMDTTLNKAVEAIETFIKQGLNQAMNMFNGGAEKDES